MLLRLELALWRRAGRRPVLWWRDDDARADTPALRRLLALSGRHAAPVTLGVIPGAEVASLAALLATAPLAAVAQHGITHRNTALPGEPASDVPRVAGLASLAAEVGRAAAMLDGLPNRLPVFIPAWNRLTPALAAAVAKAGVAALSGHARHAPALAPLPRLDVHLDLMRWGAEPRFRGRLRLTMRLVALLRERRREGRWQAPIGILTHHLAHDEAAWRYLDGLLAALRPHATIQPLATLLDLRPAGAAPRIPAAAA
jgi:hypothetical protein